MDNVFVRLMDLPMGVEGYVSMDPNGDYNVYINKDLSEEKQMAALAHEVMHINREHLRVLLPFQCCEDEI